MLMPFHLKYNDAATGNLYALYVVILIFSFHWASVIYVNSSYIERFVSSKSFSLLFIFSAILTILIISKVSTILTKIGNVRLTIVLTLLEFFSLLGMAFSDTAFVVVLFFITHQTIVPILLFNIDIFMETLNGSSEKSTGKRRGIQLSIMSLTAAIAALFMGNLVGAGEANFSIVYMTSAGLLIPFLYIIVTRFRNFTDPPYSSFHILPTIACLWKLSDIRNVIFAHFLLQLFFVWMVIYTPIYLAQHIGFNWKEIGSILFIGLLAYVLLEYLIGVLADAYFGEKEMMAFGFTIICIATSWFAYLDGSSVMVWMIAMFLTRVGASLVETTTESYFFKHMQGKDINSISIFRSLGPLSYIIGALLGFITLYYLPFEILFIMLGVCMLPGLFLAMTLRDTK